MLIIDIRAEKGINLLRCISSSNSKKAMLNKITIFIESLIWKVLKNFISIREIRYPIIIPVRIAKGTCKRAVAEKFPPFSKFKKDVKSTITKTSSTEAPAITS